VLVEYLSELASRLQQQLRDRLAAAWVVGSGALGDFDPQSSDVDVQAVSTVRLPRGELEALAAALSHDALPVPVRGLEFVLYAREDLEDPLGPAFSLNLNTGPGMEHHEGYDPEAEPRFWFTLDVAIAREHSRPLAGPSPATLLPELPRELVLAAHRKSVAWYRANAPELAAVTEARARAWETEGRWLSKGEARRRVAQGSITLPGSGRSPSGAWL
jgi:predicted nucleotidyltransferase